MNVIYDLIDDVVKMGNHSEETWDKMMHPVPKVPSVRREKYVLSRVKGWGKTPHHQGKTSG